jgi:hypothetical protein
VGDKGMRMQTLEEYRRMKGIRRPARFCSMGEVWMGNVYRSYGVQLRNGNQFKEPIDWEIF